MGRTGKFGLVVLVILLLLGGAFVVADRVAVNAAESRIAEQAKKEMVARNIKLAGDPKVSIAGFPFLTQVLAGKYDKITISADRPVLDTVQLDDFSLAATTVRADAKSVLNGSGSAIADRVTGTARMGWDAVQGILVIAGLPGLDLSQVKLSVVNDQISMRLPVAVAGQRATIVAAGKIMVEKGAVRVQVTSLSVEGADPGKVVQRFIDQNRSRMSVSVRIPSLPYKLVINRVDTAQSGVVVVASADNVNLTG